MNPKHTIKVLSCYLLVGIILFSCVDNRTKASVDSKQNNIAIPEQAIVESNVSKIELTLARGAFHYDSFQLIGNELTYFPSKEGSVDEYPEYQKTSKVILSDSIVESLTNEIVENKIMQLNSHYDCETSCTSALEMTIKINNIEKKISCEDYKAGCPEVLTNLENKLIALHGKNLKRIFLPG